METKESNGPIPASSQKDSTNLQSKSKRSRSKSPHHKHRNKHSSRHRHSRKHDKRSSRHRSRSSNSSSSRSSSPSRSRSRSRSRRDRKERHEKKKKYRFDSPPKESTGLPMAVQSSFAAPATAAASAAIGAVPAPPSILQTVQATSFIKATKADKKLYVANIPEGINAPILIDLLNSALIKLKANVKGGGPITNAWINADGSYAILEFRSEDETEKAFALNGVSVLGQKLQVGWPKTYTGSFGGTNPLVMSGLNIASALRLNNPGTPIEGPEPGLVPERKARVFPPSKIVMLKNVTDPTELMAEEDYYDLKEDIREEAAKFGDLRSIEIPRPIDDADKRPFIGKVFLEYSSIEDAKEARCQLLGRKYAGKIVETGFYPEELFYKKDFTQAI